MAHSTLYFELPIYNSDAELLGFEYKRYTPIVGWKDLAMPLMPSYKALRIWKQDEKGIRYVKNRFGDPITMPVDNDEFFLVKLKATNI